MSPQSLEALMERVTAAERSAQAARADVAALRDALARGPRRRASVGALATALVLLIAFGEAWRVANAQGGSGVIQAPLVVRGKSGGVIFSVAEGENANQATLFDRGGNGVAMVGATRDGGMFLAAGVDGETRAGIGVEEGGGGGLTLFDNTNQPIASLNNFEALRGLTVYDDRGNPKVAAATAGAKPMVLLNSDTQSPATALFVDTNDSGLAIVDPATGTPIAHLGLQTPGEQPDGTLAPAREGLTVFSTSGKPIVRAFRNPAGNGSVSVIDQNDENQGAVLGVAPGGPIVVIRTAGGVQRATLGVLDGKVAMDLKNTAGAAIVSIEEGPGGAGRLELGNPNGDTVVEAGTLEKGSGIVRVYPWRASTPGMLLGLPGTYIVGRPMGGGQ